MPAVEPFVGLRYNLGEVRLSDVIAPPYDVITPAERRRLASRHRTNAVAVELPEPDPSKGFDRYEAAQNHLVHWREDRILVPDTKPCLYPYKMTGPDGRSSTGFIGTLVLDTSANGDVLPHEETMSKPRSDRLDLLRATRTNLSPIWCLSTAAGLTTLIELDRPPDRHATDDGGALHQLWVMDDPRQIRAVQQQFSTAPVIVADGHHRYETALAYHRERVELERTATGAETAGSGSIMAFTVELAEDQLTVGPIHRAIGGSHTPAEVRAAFLRRFDVTRMEPTTDTTPDPLQSPEALVLVTRDLTLTLTAKSATVAAADADLDSSVVSLAIADLPGADVTYHHASSDALSLVTTGAAAGAVLLRPVTVSQIAQWAHARRKMPPKTTYFSPKPRTGMVFRPLDG